MGHPRDRPLAGSLPRVDQGVEYNPTSHICPEDLNVTFSNNCCNPSSDDIASFLEDPQFDGPDSSRYYCNDDLRAIASPPPDPSSHSRTPLSPHIIHGDVSSDSPSSSEIPQVHDYHLPWDDYPLQWHDYPLEDLTRHPCSPSQDVPSELSLGHSSPAQRRTTPTNHERHEIDWESNHDNSTSLSGPSSHGPSYPAVQRNIGTPPSIDFGQFVHWSPEPPVPDDILKATRKRTSGRRSRGKHLQIICDSCQKEFSRRCDLNKHVKIHDHAFKCNITGCSFTQGFALQKDLRRHINTIHWKSTFTCHDCGEIFSRSDNCQRHVEEQHS